MTKQPQKLTTEARVEDAACIMSRYNLNPLEELSRLAVEARQRGDDLSVESICKYLMPYVHPKLKAYDIQVASTISNHEMTARLLRGRERLLKLNKTPDLVEGELHDSDAKLSFL